jgi:hypothetical protein
MLDDCDDVRRIGILAPGFTDVLALVRVAELADALA